MPLLAYNLTGSPVTLSGLSVVLPAAPSVNLPGRAVNVTGALKNLSGSEYTALEAQRPNTVLYNWTDLLEYDTGDLQTVTGNAIRHVADYASLPSADTHPWNLFETDDDGAVYYSNAVTWVQMVGSGVGRAPAVGTDGAVDVESPSGVLGARRRLTVTDIDNVVADTDPRLSDARTPTTHASTHKGDGTDPIANATTSVAGLLSAADKIKVDAALQSVVGGPGISVDAGDPNNPVLTPDGWRYRVRGAAVINQGSPPSGGGSYGGITVADGDRFLIRSNAALPATSGLWVVSTTTAWTRPTDAPTGSHASATVVYVQEGTDGGKTYVCTTLPPNDVVGTNQTDWGLLFVGGRLSGGFTIFDDPLGAGTWCSSDTVGIAAQGAIVVSMIRALGDYPTFTPSTDYSRIGSSSPYYRAWGEGTFRQLGTKQFDHEAALSGPPTISSVVSHGANNGVTRGYKVVAYRYGGDGIGGYGDSTEASTEVTDGGNSATVLGGTEYNEINWSAVTGAYGYGIYLTSSSIGENLGLIGQVLTGTLTFNHNGQAANTNDTAPALRMIKVDTYNGAFQTMELTEDVEFRISDGGGGFPTSGSGTLKGQHMTLRITQGASAPWTISKPTNMAVEGGSMTLSASTGAVDVYRFIWDETLGLWLQESAVLDVS